MADIDPDVRAYLEEAPEEFLRCRLLTHNWDLTHPLGTYVIRNEGQPDEEWTTELTCARCGLPGVDFFEPWTCLRLGTRQIKYPQVDGYLAPVPVPKEAIRQFLAEKHMTRRGNRRMLPKPAATFRVAS